jgi:cell division protein FtsN
VNSQREAQQSRLARRNRIAIVVGLLIVQALTAWLISAQARSDTETSQRHLFTEVCLRNNITKGVMRVNEVRRRLIGERWVPQLRGSSIVGRHRAEQGAADF